MKASITALTPVFFFAAPATAHDPSGNGPSEFSTAAEARACVTSEKSWRECLGLPPSCTITAFSTYESRIDFSDHPLAKPEGFKFRAPWSRSAIDFLIDPNFNRT